MSAPSRCALCGEPNVQPGDAEAPVMGKLSLWLDGTGRTRVVHSACKRQRQAAAHGGRMRLKPPRGPRRVD